ncbi:MAG: hypothetical protein ISN29_02980 [Gammaproteobacteria bacterium AqS3]|nr:hypothetical protein [Gammaproteobacteria bacterium AqS3]
MINKRRKQTILTVMNHEVEKLLNESNIDFAIRADFLDAWENIKYYMENETFEQRYVHDNIAIDLLDEMGCVIGRLVEEPEFFYDFGDFDPAYDMVRRYLEPCAAWAKN